MFYKFKHRMNEDLVVLTHPKYGQQIWVKSKPSKNLRCVVLGEYVRKGTIMYHPITNACNRMERISEKGMKLLESMKI